MINRSLKSTIALPHLGVNSSLYSSIESIYHQDTLPDEVIILSQGLSKDQLLSLSDFTTQFSLQSNTTCRIYNLGDFRGLVLAKRLAQELFSTDILIFTEDDLILPPNYISTTLSFFEDNPTVRFIFLAQISLF